MTRRDTIFALLALCAAPLASRAQQQGKILRVGFLVPRPRPESIESDLLGGFPRGMRELGYVEGRNLIIEWRFADGKSERLPALAEELVRMNVDVLVAGSSPAIRALQKATTTIPIVMATSGDPIGSGFVKSLARPGGNITGLSNLLGDAAPKQLELLRAIAPKLSRVAHLVNPVNPALATSGTSLQSAAQSIGVTVLPVEARSAQEIDNAFRRMIQAKVEALIVPSDSLFIQQSRRIAELAASNRMLSSGSFREYAEAGGLASYGPNLVEQFRRAATYVDKLFKGARAAEMAVEQTATFELLINGKTAKALGITIPQSVLLRADVLIQ